VEWIRRDSSGTWQLGAYFDYLASIGPRLSAGARDFALPLERYSIDDAGSLHDCWLDSLLIEEPALGQRSEQRTTRIRLVLLGNQHDRWHELTYSGVRRYQIEVPDAKRGHADLIVHEVRIGDDGAVVHELLFAGDSTIEIEAADLSYSVRPAGS
jgi:hypothetical protein